MCVCPYLLSGCFVFHILKGNLNDLAHVFNHILDVFGGLFAIRVDWGLPCPGEVIAVLDGCSKLGLDHGCAPWLQGQPKAN
jgi:hypothetical protein